MVMVIRKSFDQRQGYPFEMVLSLQAISMLMGLVQGHLPAKYVHDQLCQTSIKHLFIAPNKHHTVSVLLLPYVEPVLVA